MSDAPKYSAELYRYRVLVTRIIDGDTLEGLFDNGRRRYDFDRIRFSGIDAPERRGNEREEGIVSTAALLAWVKGCGMGGQNIPRWVHPSAIVGVIYVATVKEDSFGRWLARVQGPDGEDAGEWMVQMGYAEVDR